jgi:hypothetical protein
MFRRVMRILLRPRLFMSPIVAVMCAHALRTEKVPILGTEKRHIPLIIHIAQDVLLT